MNKRQMQILEILTDCQKMEVVKLSELLAVSQVTIRKDLALLESSGIIQREHGYAKINVRDDINTRLAYHYQLKEQIAKLAVESISDGETVMIESGSCCALLALEIAKTRKDVTLITNSAFIADYTRNVGNVKVILLGGEYQPESQVLVGPITRKGAQSFFVDKFFIGTDGFSIKYGFTGKNYMRSETVSDMAEQAQNVIIVTESSKFNKQGVVSLIGIDKVSRVITDSGIPEDAEEYLTGRDIEVLKI